ncbi:MAG: 2-dehydro-3-deoxygalactonokinase [Rhodobacteraceae bacterium]|nr:2-dehydro-3-deoxygalactonokinase [Paracoccaceae bacterium]
METDVEISWIAVDWGTTNLRVWLMDEAGRVVGQRASDAGMGSLSRDAFEPALLALIGDVLRGDRVTPVLACGMVGARQGWIEAPYVSVPCTPPGVEHAVTPPVSDPRVQVLILPGVSQAKPADVMRGEETQIAGFLALNPDFDGVLCLPGTHTKWVHISAGEIVSFRTFMTGELFALLSGQSVLRHGFTDGDWEDAAFLEALRDTLSRPESLAADLFSIRAAGLLHDLPGPKARARVSGLLLGVELRGARPYWLGQRVAVIGPAELSRLYEIALAEQGVTVERAKVDEVTLAGLKAAWAKANGENA